MNHHAEHQRGRLRAPSLKTLLATQFPPRDFLVSPWLRQGESAMVWAAPGVGKTMLSLSIALAVAGGGKLFGWTSATPRRVLVVDGEMNTADLVERCRLLMPAIEGIDAQRAAANVVILARQHQEPETKFPDLAEEAGREAVFRKARDGDFDLVILDNFSTLATVDDENAAAAMSPVLTFLMTLKQANIACLLVHHSGKSGDDYRGSSKLATTFETILGLRKVEGPLARHGTAFELTWQKYRRQRTEAIRDHRAWLEECSGSGSRWCFELSENEECADMLSLLRSLKFATQGELATAMKCSTGKLSKLKHQAIGAKRITEGDWNDLLASARALREETTGEGEDY